MSGGFGFSRLGMDSMKYNRSIRKGRKLLAESKYHGQVRLDVKEKPDFDAIDELRGRQAKARRKRVFMIILGICFSVLALISYFHFK
jgi:hypothetical protein